MYVEWLLEFIWRIFIQGPLLLINFFTNATNLNKLFGQVRFDNNIVGFETVSGLFNLAIILSLAVCLFLMVFIYKMIKIVIKSGQYGSKQMFIEAIKAFAKSIILMLVFGVCFQAFFVLFDTLIASVVSVLNKFTGAHNEISKISELIYSQITNGAKLENKNFLFPKDLLNQMDAMNWIISIAFCISFAWFLIWCTWSIFQKMIEIFFLYWTFPISIAFSMESNQINYQIWIKEIINKVVVIFLLMFLSRIFLYMFYFINTSIIDAGSKWKNPQDKLYVSFFSTIAIISAMMFLCKFLSLKHFESIGVFASFKSYKQTRNFISNNRSEIQTYQPKIDLSPINENINSLKNEISRLNFQTINHYQNLDRIKVFKQ